MSRSDDPCRIWGDCHLLTEGRSAPYALTEHVLSLLSHLWQMLKMQEKLPA